MPSAKAAKTVRGDLFAAFEELVHKAMQPDIPIPQRQALFNRAQELRAQWIELEAARFDSDAAAFHKTQDRVAAAVADLRAAIGQIDDMVKIAEKATRVFGLLDRLLKQAVKFVAL